MRICPQCGAETTALTCRNDGFGTVDAGRYRRLDPSHLLGTLFQDRYRIDAVLGSGGMGSVYRATQVRVGRLVALKVINADLAYDLAVVARFQREGRAIATLIHPNIVQVYDFGQTDEGELFMAMELVHGRTLADVIREEAPIEPSRVVQLGAQIFDALAEAHEHGVIHRDLKPENIFITETGRRRDVVKILDFGVAKIVNEPKSESMVTARGAILGSPKYMAPEQARGKGVTGHADLYATGGILYEALTGHAVFNEPSPADYLVAHSVKMPSAPTVNGRELRGPLVDLIMKCLEKKPWNRPDGAGRALEAIEAARLAPVVEPGDSAPVVVRELLADHDAGPQRHVRPAMVGEAPAIPTEATRAESPPALPQAATTIPVPRAAGRLEVETPALSLASVMVADDEVDVEDLRPRVVTPAIARVERVSAAPPIPEPIAPVDTRRLGSQEQVAARAGAQEEPTLIAPAETSDSLRAVHVVLHEEPRRTGGLWLLAALLLLFVGAFVYLAANDFFRGTSGAERTAGAANMRRAVEDPVQAGSIGPAQRGPSTVEPVAASAEGPIPGEATVAAGDGAAAAARELGPGGEATTMKSVAGASIGGAEAAAAAGATAPGEADPGLAAKDDGAAAGTSGEAKRDERPAGVEVAKADDAKATSDQPGANPAAMQQAAPKATTKGVRFIPNRGEPQRTTIRLPRVDDPLADLEDADFPKKPKANDDHIHQVLVDSSPSGAEIKMGALPLGNTPLRVEWKDLGQPVHVVITKEGFHPHHVMLSAAQARLRVNLRPVMMQAP